MKVVCGSCGAKYSVADDKVAGKTVKIRCKKCSEVIVVHGEQQNPFEEDEATRVFDYGGEAVWHVVVNGEQQGPFAPLQVGALLMEGKVDAEAYVWKEGFDGWKALRDVPELSSLATKGGDAPQVEADLESDGGDLFGAAAKPAAAAAAPAEAAGGDLFASSASKSSSAFAGGDEDDGVVASSPSSPRVSAQQASMTGQRNENSVLFSLSNLQALATGPAAGSSSSSSSPSFGASSSPAAAAPSKPAGHAVGEASGLIDIRALASATSAMGASKPSSSANVDDLLSIGAGPSPLASPLAAPVLAPMAPKREEEPKRSNTGLMVGLGMVGVALIGAVGFLGYKVMNQTPQERIVERVVVQGGGDDNEDNANSAPAAAAGSETQQVAAATGTTGSSGSSRSARTTGTTASSGSSASNTASATPSASAMSESASAGSTSSQSSGSTTDAMRRLLASMTTASPSAPAPAAAPAAMPAAAPAAESAGGGPNRAEIGAALGGLRGAVSACGDGTTHGVASVRVTFATNGSVSAVSVGGDFAGTPAAGCISRAVRGAHISAFQGSPTAVTYPYRL